MAKLSVPLSSKPRQWYDARTYCPGRRTFSAEAKRLALESAASTDTRAARPTGGGDIVFDHVVPWELTHDSSLKNCQVLCLTCDRLKTYERDLPAIALSRPQGGLRPRHHGPGPRQVRAARRAQLAPVQNHPQSRGAAPLTNREAPARFIARRYEFRAGGGTMVAIPLWPPRAISLALAERLSLASKCDLPHTSREGQADE
jgi:hypothetical protein